MSNFFPVGMHSSSNVPSIESLRADYETARYYVTLEQDSADALADSGHHDLAALALDRARAWADDVARLQRLMHKCVH